MPIINVVDGIVGTIGQTPVVELRHKALAPHKRLYLKLEQFNPNLSVKDRTALGLVRTALDTGRLQRGGTVIESTSGNLGKSLAMLGAALGFRVIIVVDPKVSRNALNWFRAYGAEVDKVSIPDGAGNFQKARIARVQELLKLHPGAYWPNQYDNPDNADFHASETCEEIRHLALDFVAGSVSTGGHLTGIARRLRAEQSPTEVLASDVHGSAVFGSPFQPYLLNGLGLAWRAANTDLDLYDFTCLVSDQEAISMCRLLAGEHGLLLGGSGGVVVCAALSHLRNSAARTALAIIPDSGVNYLDQFYDDEWLRDRQVSLFTSAELAAALDGRVMRRQNIQRQAG
jgi:N-(2-amino-2-carboxyethyl)-L-glutamate synthase